MIHTLFNLPLADASFWLPTSGSNTAAAHDPVWNLVLGITTVFFFLVVGMMFLFIFKFRRGSNLAAAEGPTHNTPLEISWTVIPLILVLGLFVVGLKGYMWYDKPPSNAYTIVAVLKQWDFTFYYPNGGVSSDLYVPQSSDANHRPIRILIEADPSDVLHAMYIPAYRIQRGAVPGRITEMWFEATELPPVHPGASPEAKDSHYFDIFCTQYCGKEHSTMHSRVFVIPTEAAFNKKLDELANPFADENGKLLPLAEVGKKLVGIYGCLSCHTIDGTKNTGPTWKGLYKSDVPFSKIGEPGFTLKKTDSDEIWMAYLNRSIIDPGADIVEGFQDQMTRFGSQLAGPDPNDPNNDNNRRRFAIIEYIKSVGDPAYYKPAPLPVAQTAPGAAATTQSGK